MAAFRLGITQVRVVAIVRDGIEYETLEAVPEVELRAEAGARDSGNARANHIRQHDHGQRIIRRKNGAAILHLGRTFVELVQPRSAQDPG